MSTTKILFVDDEPDVESMMRQRFRRSRDLELLFARDGASALSSLRENAEVGLVVSDINMPVMDGLSMLGELKTIDRPIKVVVVSAYGDMDNIRSAMNRGAFDFVTKPINFQDLSTTIDKARGELERLDEGRKVKQQLNALQTELSVASRIQQSMLPRSEPKGFGNKAFDIHAKMIAARSIGGDFYDYFHLDDDHLAFLIGDVSGKGVPAALFMSSARTLLRATARLGKSTGECVAEVNRILARESDPAMFLTLFFGVLDLRTGLLECTSGGHNSPILVTQGKASEYCLVPPGLIVGALDGMSFESHEVRLEPGSVLFLYTDGISEAENIQQEEFSEQRLLAAVEAARTEGLEGLCDTVIAKVKEHAGEAEQSDDMTVVALRFKG